MVSGGSVRVTGWPSVSTQPADAILAILENWVQLCVIRIRISRCKVPQTYGGFDADLHDVGELTPAVAALAALASAGVGFAAHRHRASAWP